MSRSIAIGLHVLITHVHAVGAMLHGHDLHNAKLKMKNVRLEATLLCSLYLPVTKTKNGESGYHGYVYLTVLRAFLFPSGPWF